MGHAILGDGQVTFRYRRAGTAGKVLTGHLGRGGEIFDQDRVGAGYSSIVRGRLDRGVATGGRGIGVEGRSLRIVELFHRFLVHRKRTLERRYPGKHGRVVGGLALDLVRLGIGIRLDEHINDLVDVYPGTQTDTR
ncbi:hypothetical protein D9M71_477870 [compost metagenome]